MGPSVARWRALLGCVLVAACSSAAPDPGLPPAPTADTSATTGSERPPPEPACVETVADAPPPLLVTHGASIRAGVDALPPAPAPPRARTRRDHGRRVIELDCIDCVVSNVSVLTWDGTVTTLGAGWSPRGAVDGTVAWIRSTEAGAPELVRRSRDGTLTTAPPLAGAVALLGGFADEAAAPFTPDRRYQLTACDAAGADACDRDPSGGAVVALHADDPTLERAPIERLASTSCSDLCRADLFVSDDASVLAGCVRGAGDERTFVRLDRTTGARIERVVPGACAAFDALGERVVVVRREPTTGVTAALEIHDVRGGDPIALSTAIDVHAARFTPCGDAVIVAGRAPGGALVRVERIEAGTTTTLLEAPADLLADVVLALDARGWAVVTASAPDTGTEARIWAVPIRGGEPRTLVVESERLWEVVLGPDDAQRTPGAS